MTLDLGLFHDPEYGGEGIAQSWIRKASSIRLSDGYVAQFDRFSYLWMAFNAWGMCVTLAETDAKMLEQLKKSTRVENLFNEVIHCTNLRNEIMTIEENFPLASFSDLIRLDPRYNWRGERDSEYWKKIAEAPLKKKVRLSPRLDHRNLNWADTLDCIYKVRCNLVHGGKMANYNEATFVGIFSNMLEALLAGKPTNLLDLR
jgi:hypothetical protein